MKSLIVIATLVLASGVGNSVSAEERLFTAYNIWFESPLKVYSTNYQKGNLLPAGSEVKEVNRFSGGLEFVDVNLNMKFSIEFVGKHHPGVTAEQWINRFLTSSDFPALTMGLTASEIDAIKAGEVKVGMSKRAVLLSVGYPPEVATASTDLDIWKFWRNRFGNYLVKFTNGKVSSSKQ
jgi:hypothetical protein